MPDIFVIGCPRSGTTLLRTILDGGDEIAIPAETHFIPNLLRCRHLMSLGRPGRRVYVKLAFLNGTLARSGYSYQEAVQFFDQAEGAGPDDAPGLLDDFLRRASGVRLLGDKTPTYVYRLPQLMRAYPEARFVCIERDQTSVVRSLLGTSWGPNSPRAARYMWRRAHRMVRRAESDRRVMTLSYASLVARPEEEVTRVCEFLQVVYQPEMLETSTRAAAATALHNFPAHHQELARPLGGGGRLDALERADEAIERDGRLDVLLGPLAYAIYRCRFIRQRWRTILRLIGRR